ncbi:hypothetical protein AB0M95_33345 [Sphaerisporangium sp. NPDC051017]|uniref:hypothetical protein n=1 Tax=Sphaerisporangium sp. NPDC051017 TaxID=3154636 RepID=UPI00342AE7CD
MFKIASDWLTPHETALHEFWSDPAVTGLTDCGPNTTEDTRSFVASVMAPRGVTHIQFAAAE